MTVDDDEVTYQSYRDIGSADPNHVNEILQREFETLDELKNQLMNLCPMTNAFMVRVPFVSEMIIKPKKIVKPNRCVIA